MIALSDYKFFMINKEIVMKKTRFSRIAVIAAVIGFTLITCDTGGGGGKPEPVEQPKNQSATISNLYGKGITVAVQGYLTDSEWNGVAGKIETALNTRYDTSSDGTKSNLLIPIFTQFGQGGSVTIIVEKNPSYANYSATYGGNIIHINFAIINDPTALDSGLYNATRVLSEATSVPEQG